MTRKRLDELIEEYKEAAALCDRLGFRQAALVWRYRIDVFSDPDHPVTRKLLAEEAPAK